MTGRFKYLPPDSANSSHNRKRDYARPWGYTTTGWLAILAGEIPVRAAPAIDIRDCPVNFLKLRDRRINQNDSTDGGRSTFNPQGCLEIYS